MKQELDEILFACCKVFEVSEDCVLSKSRKQELVYCRKAFCLIVKRKYNLKLEFIARRINISIAGAGKHFEKQPSDNYYNSRILLIENILK